MTKILRGVGILAVLLTVVLAGCAGLQNPDGTPLTAEQYFERYEHVIKLGVQVGVINLLETNPTYGVRVKEFAGYMENYLAGHSYLNLEELETVARDKIDWDPFDPTERLLVDALIVTIRTELGNVLTANNLPAPPEKVAFYANKFLAWVHEGALVFEASMSDRGVVPLLQPLQ